MQSLVGCHKITIIIVHNSGLSAMFLRTGKTFWYTARLHYKKRGRAQLVHYQRMHVVSKVSKSFPRYTWEISWTPWKLRAFSGSVQVVHSLYSCSVTCRITDVRRRSEGKGLVVPCVCIFRGKTNHLEKLFAIFPQVT